MFVPKMINVSTCEDIAGRRGPTRPLTPPENGNPFQFLVQDPFGLRRAIVPVFLSRAGGQLVGAGTAFHVDHWGTLVTADHVIEEMRESVKFKEFVAGDEQQVETSPFGLQAHILLGGIAGYGTYRLPEGMITRVVSVRSPIRISDDPMAALQGRSNLTIAADVAVLKTAKPPNGEWRDTLPIRVSGWRPSFGETVAAIGFPEIESQVLDQKTALHLLKEGMYCAYGKIVGSHPNGRDRTNPTPVIEVEANWPSGMSGGPVLNQAGEVVGLVSRSLTGDESGQLGNGWAACFQLIPSLAKILPMIDPFNPNWRRGWAVLRRTQWHVESFSEYESEAKIVLDRVGPDFQLAYGSMRIGSDDFIAAPLRS